MKNEKIVWSDEYSIGIRAIDTQHKKLFMLVNKLYDLNEFTTTKEEIRSILYDFSDYMQTHFKEEEEYMFSIGYDRLEEHKKMHKKLIDSLALVIKNPVKLSILKTKMKVISKRALLTHIIKEDTKIKEFQIRDASALNITNFGEVKED